MYAVLSHYYCSNANIKTITLFTHYTCTIVANAVKNMSLNHNVLCLTLKT